MFSLHVFLRGVDFYLFGRKQPEFWSCMSIDQKYKSIGTTRCCSMEGWIHHCMVWWMEHPWLPHGKCFKRAVLVWWSQCASLGEPSGSQLASAAGPGASCSPCRQPVLGPRSGSSVPSWQSIWGQLEERAGEILSAWYPHSDRWDHSQVREKSSLSTGMRTCLQGMCKAAFGNASCATLQQSYLCITWLWVIQGDVHNKKDQKHTDLLLCANSCFSVDGIVMQ